MEKHNQINVTAAKALSGIGGVISETEAIKTMPKGVSTKIEGSVMSSANMERVMSHNEGMEVGQGMQRSTPKLQRRLGEAGEKEDRRILDFMKLVEIM